MARLPDSQPIQPKDSAPDSERAKPADSDADFYKGALRRVDSHHEAFLATVVRELMMYKVRELGACDGEDFAVRVRSLLRWESNEAECAALVPQLREHVATVKEGVGAEIQRNGGDAATPMTDCWRSATPLPTHNVNFSNRGLRSSTTSCWKAQRPLRVRDVALSMRQQLF